MDSDKVQTYRVSTHKINFGSPTWRLINMHLTAAGIYWFLTDPIDSELIALKVLKAHKHEFLGIVNAGEYDAEFHITEYWE